MRKFLFKTTMEVSLANGNRMPSEIDVHIEYGVTPGRKATHIDPPEEPSVEILRVWIAPEGQPRMLAPNWLDCLASDDEELQQEMLCDAAEREQAARDDAADAKREDWLMHGRSP